MRNSYFKLALSFSILTFNMPSAIAANSAVAKARTTVFNTAKVSDVGGQKTKCEQRKLTDKKGNVLATLCKKDYKNCRMQGSCLVQTENGNKLVNVADNSGKTWSVIDQNKCKFGTGAVIKNERSCLIPYKSLACDKGVKPGTVVYMREAVGLSYQVDGGPVQRHDGHFICSDTGGHINGAGRFDVYTGYSGEPKNEFLNAGFADKNIGKFHYAYVTPGKLQDDNKVIADLQNLVLTSGHNTTTTADGGRTIASGNGTGAR